MDRRIVLKPAPLLAQGLLRLRQSKVPNLPMRLAGPSPRT